MFSWLLKEKSWCQFIVPNLSYVFLRIVSSQDFDIPDSSLDVGWKQRHKTLSSGRGSSTRPSYRPRIKEDPESSQLTQSCLRFCPCGRNCCCILFYSCRSANSFKMGSIDFKLRNVAEESYLWLNVIILKPNFSINFLQNLLV